VCLAAGFLLAGGVLAPRARGQSEGLTQGVICVVGAESNERAPIVLVDVPDQTMVVYEYNYQSSDIELVAARTFRFDKLLEEYRNDGVTVEEVRQEVTRPR
jgi:hypothetical protein